jgi:hypothetical protein
MLSGTFKIVGAISVQSFNIINKGYVPANLVKGSPLANKINNVSPRGRAICRVTALNSK